MTQLHSTYQTLSRLSSALLILLWSYAALSKLAAYPNFHSELMGHELIRSYADTLTWLVPFIELIIVFLLIIKRVHRIHVYGLSSYAVQLWRGDQFADLEGTHHF
jgi:hypothetical protein